MAEIEKPMMNEHTAKAFDSDLQELTRKVAEMGGLAEREIADAVEQRDVELIRVLVKGLEKLDVDRQGFVELPFLLELGGLLLQLCDVGHQRLTDPDGAENAPIGPGESGWLS